MIKLLELFGGIGAPRKALENIGLDVKSIDYVEIDDKPVRSYNAMFDNNKKPQNICGWDLKPDILVHGSPCQDISIAGKMLGADKESGTRSSLMWETLRIIDNFGVWKPKIVVWENVTGVLHKRMVKNFKQYLWRMESMGYSNSFSILNAMDFGLPQKRKRVFTVSVLSKTKFDFGKVVKRNRRSLHDFLGNYGKQHIMWQPSMLKNMGGNDSAFSNRIMPINDYCYTITVRQDRCPNSGVIAIGDGKYRYLTERECWRLQGFSDIDYDNALKVNPCKPGRMNRNLYKQAGNSMPVTILEEIFKSLLINKTNCG
jgi:DNA (cytosine-5)-methyltransferase 1